LFGGEELHIHKKTCACGKLFIDCNYWNTIREKLRLKYGSDNININTNSNNNFSENNYSFISTILNHSGKKYYLDSSKNLARLQGYLASDLFNVYIIHLIRDGRAVAYSNTKPVNVEARIAQGKKNLSFKNYLLGWQENNLLIRELFKNNPNYIISRYEDIVTKPKEEISKILSILDLSFENDQIEKWHEGQHNVDGNRMKWSESSKIEADQKYLKKISWIRWIRATLKIKRALKTFGYSTNFWKK